MRLLSGRNRQRGVNEIKRLVLRSSPDPLPCRGIVTLYMNLLAPPQVLTVPAHLDGSLPFLENLESSRLFLLRYVIVVGKSRGIRPLGVFEDEHRVVLDLVDQPQGVFEVPFGFAWKAHDDVGRDGD